MEADCLSCHLPEYDYQARKKQIAAWNFRWAAAARARFASVKGSVQKGEPVEVVYETRRFNPDGTVEPHIVREPRKKRA